MVSLLGGTDLNYVAHACCVRRASADGQKQREFLEKTVLTRQKEQADKVGLNCRQRATDNDGWQKVIPQRLSSTELSWEQFQDNLLFRYGIVPLNLPTNCDGCGKKFLMPHNLSCPKGGLNMAWNNDTCKKLVALLDWAINPSALSYELKIKSRAVQGERNGSRVRVAMVS